MFTEGEEARLISQVIDRLSLHVARTPGSESSEFSPTGTIGWRVRGAWTAPNDPWTIGTPREV